MASLDVIGHALFTLHPGGKLLQHNAAGEAILERNDGVRLIDGRLRPIDTAGRRALEAAIERAGAPGLPPPSAFYLRRAHGGRYEVSVVSTASSAGRQIVVALTDPDSHDGTLASRLRDRYGLSASEAEVAVRLSEGASAQQLSDERKTSLDTVRTQIKAILAKMDCNRQAEVVTLVNQMPQFHMPTDDEAQ